MLYLLTANLGLDEADAAERSYLNQHYSIPPTESNVNFGGSYRFSTSGPSFHTDQTQSARPVKKVKTHHESQELNMTSEKFNFVNVTEEATNKEHLENDLYRNSARSNSHGSIRKSPIRSVDHSESMEPGTQTGFTNKQRTHNDIRENSRKNRKPVKIPQETDNTEEESQSSDDAVIVKSEPQEESVKSENQTNKSSGLFAGLDLNVTPGLHKYGSETYLSKPAFDPGKSPFLYIFINCKGSLEKKTFPMSYP